MRVPRSVGALVVLGGIAVYAMVWHVSRLQSGLVRSSALQAAEIYTAALTEFRVLYTTEIVARVRPHGVDVTLDYTAHDGAIPVPATVSMMLGERIGRQVSGAQAYLYSPFPWRRHDALELRDPFYREAWEALSREPAKPYYRFESRSGPARLRYAVADLMLADCIECHNRHPQSPKRDWKTGDLRGVLAVNLPLDRIVAQTSADLRKTTIVYAAIGFSVASMMVIAFVRIGDRSRALDRRVRARTAELEAETSRSRAAVVARAETEERFRSLLDSAAEGIYGLDLEGRVTFVNPAACRMLGYTEAELRGRPMHELVHHSDLDGSGHAREQCPIDAAFTDGTTHSKNDEVLWRSDGSSFPVEYTSSPMRRGGRLVGAVVLFTDVSERRKLEERFRLGIEASPAAMIMVDENGGIVHVNHEVEKLFGYAPGELIARPVELLIPAAEARGHAARRNEYLHNPETRRIGGRDVLGRRKNGEVFPAEVRLNPIRTREGTLVLCAVLDLTERKKFETTVLHQAQQLEAANKLLSEQVTTDSLTNIANRRGFFAQFETLIVLSRRKARPISLVITDLDYFKAYNDDFGHPAGDLALRAVARVLSRQIRASDIVARYGGEEFGILLPETDETESRVVAEKMRAAIDTLAGLERPVTMSFGIATHRLTITAPFDVSQIIENLVRDADKALYHSKQQGRNRVTHFHDMEPRRH